jgi:glycosyltransferase involved in cell wall biosynthesis
MRLLFVIDNLGSGGAQRQMVTLASELSKRAHQIDFFLYSPGEFFTETMRSANIRIFRCVKPSRFSVRPVIDLRRRIKKGSYDAILSYMVTPNTYAVLARQLTRTKSKLVVSERSCVLEGGTSWSRFLIEQLYRCTDRVVVNSHHMRDHFAHRYPWIRNRVSVIWNGLDLERFRAFSLELEKDPFQLLVVGRMAVCKNWMCLVRALAILRDRHGIKVFVDAAGRTDGILASDRCYGEQLNTTLAEEGLTEQWKWLGERSDVPELMRNHHAVIHPAYRDGLSNVVCEALASGRPVIIPDMLDNPRLVQHGKTGFLFDWRCPEDLAKAIHRLYRLSDEERRRMGDNARAFAETHLSAGRLADEYERLFHDVCARAKGIRSAKPHVFHGEQSVG